MNKNTLTDQWSPELAKQVEGWLITILNSIPGVSNAHGCSFDKYQDFKVIFDYEDAETSVRGCYLAFLPEGKDYIYPRKHSALAAWAGGLSTYWPKPIICWFNTLFPHSSQTDSFGAGRDPWHYWLFVTEKDLEKLAQQIANW